MAAGLIHEKIWMDKSKYDDAERQHFEGLAKLPKAAKGCPKEIDSNPLPSSPETHGSQPRKTKVTKSRLQDYTSVVELCDFKEKTNKKSKKAREANRQREMMLDSISNKELPPSPAREEPLARATPAAPAAPAARAPSATPAAPAARAPSATPAPASEAPKPAKKEPNQKLSKAEKKRANKREKEEAAATSKVETKTAEKVVAAASVASAVIGPPAKSDVAQGGSSQVGSVQGSSLASEVAKARQHIKNTLECMDTVLASVHSDEVVNRISSLETALGDLRKLVIDIQSEVKTLAQRIPAASAPAPAVCSLPAKAPKAPVAAAPAEDSDDGVDLFASDSDGEDDDAAAKIREERLANYAAKKSTKPVLIAKSNIILDVKPWDDETDMKVLEEKVREIVCDGLLWGASKLVTLAYGIQKLQISCVVEDDKVSIDWLQEEIEKNEDYVQSVDIAAFNKV